MRVTKTFYFSAAHRLSKYLGKKERIHGHNYQGIATIHGAELQDNDMLIDFSEISRAIQSEIIDKFDHRLFLKEGTTQNIEIANVIPEDWVVWFKKNPTTEIVAEEIRNILQLAFGSNYEVTIELFENDTSSVIAEHQDNFGI